MSLVMPVRRLFRVRAKINLRFQELRHLHGKAPKCSNIVIFPGFDNTARQDASAHKNVKLFLREPLPLQRYLYQ
jgi:hypothetical protein